MNSLLKRQIRKFLPEDLSSNKNLELFLDAINRSYENFEEQSFMIQRAMEISSQELSEANKQLKDETKTQLKVINKLKEVINTLKFYELPESSNLDALELDGSKLVDFINKQTKEIINMNRLREKLLDDLAEQNEELSDYAHMVSHDLKSPLRSIHALTVWLNEDYKDKLDDVGRQNLNLIRNNVEKMESLINGILNYSEIADIELKNSEIDTNKLVKDVLEIVHKPKNISINIKGDLPILIGDKYKLQQLFQNLIDNAIKYCDKNKGIVEIGVENLEESYQFYIKDNGKGIEEAYFNKIFKRFQKLENNNESSGIGLAIVKKIIDLYKGRIWLESEVGKGTTFYFTLKK